MPDVAIIGVGLHPFGRFGPKSAIDMAADATRTACADAGVQWKDVQFAFGGSFEVDNPDAVTGRLGLTGIPFMDVYNGCATAATALQMTADAIRSGQYELVLQLRGTAGERQVSGTPRVGYAQLYGAPGTAGVSILST